MHIWHMKSFNIPVSIALATLVHMINVYEIYPNATNYPIYNMQDFRFCLWTSILDCFGQLVSPRWWDILYEVAYSVHHPHPVVTKYITILTLPYTSHVQTNNSCMAFNLHKGTVSISLCMCAVMCFVNTRYDDSVNRL